MTKLLEPTTKEINGRSYILSKFPAVAGREIVTQYTVSGMPKIGDYKVNEQMMLKLMSHVAVQINDAQIPLSNQVLIDNHIPDWETLMKVEMAMMEYNCSFFQNGRVSTFFQDVAQKLPLWISKMWTTLLEQSSRTEKQP